MSFSDIFYPGNPERRQRLTRKAQELLELMKNNFRATNQLIEALQKHLGWSFRPVSLNENATVKENCDVLIEHIHEIQVEVEKINQLLKEKLEPTLYEKLMNMSLSVPECQQMSAACGVPGVSAVVLIGWLISNGYIFTSIAVLFGLLATGYIAHFVFGGMISIGGEMVFSAILGGIERAQLEKALEEYDRILEEFRPASEKYQGSITFVRIIIEMS